MAKHFPFALLCAIALASGCTDTSGETAISNHNYSQFGAEVYQVLLRDCGFPACHGNSDRIFRVYGPGRVRLPLNGEIPGPFESATVAEIRRTFQLAQAHRNAEDPAQSMLLRKPLAAEAGGTSHQGVDQYGRDVYRTEADNGYVVIARWVFSEEPTEEEGN